jgi:hypothetical protein
VQAEQIVGRLLRQPERKLYQAQRLNRAEIFVRVEKIGVFDEVVGAVEEKLSTGRLDIKVITTKPGRKLQEEIAPRKSLTVPVPAILTDRAEKRIAEHISNLTDYRNDDGTNTRGKGKRASVQRIVGSESGPTVFLGRLRRNLRASKRGGYLRVSFRESTRVLWELQ